MTDTILQLAHVIQREFDALKIMAQNSANISTIGYRSESFFSTLNSPLSSTVPAIEKLDQIEQRSYINPNNGSLMSTNRDLDFAVGGKGWFVINTDDGIALTRDGHFHIDASGTLLNRQGYTVLDKDLKPVMWSKADTSTLKVDQSGAIWDQDEQKIVNYFKIVDAAPTDIISLGNSMYRASNFRDLNIDELQVFQRKLEQSNSIMSQDMIKIMELSRHIESMQRAVNAYDTLLDNGINQLGK